MTTQRILICLSVLCLSILVQVQSAIITVYEPRRRCPNTEEKWREREAGYICPPQTQYHCMLTGDGQIVEFCSDITWIEHDYCPMFNSKTRIIDVQLCPENGDCPRKQYLSNTVYKYPDCLQTYRTTSVSKEGGNSLESVKTIGSTEEPSYSINREAMDALRLTSIEISIKFMVINLVLLSIILIVLIVLIYPHVRKDKVDVSKPKSEEDGSPKEEADPEISRTHSRWSWEQNTIRLMIIKFFRCEKKIHGPTH